MKTNRHSSRFLELRALSSLEHLRFTTRQRMDGAYSGRHLSRQQGGSGEFVDFREYTSGDDLRRLDWKVLGRTGRRYLRLYQDETNLSCTLVLDASGSMRFGGLANRGADGAGSKLEYAQFLASALTYLITQGQDQVGLAIVSDVLRTWERPGADPEHVARVLDAIERLTTRPATDFSGALRDLFLRTSRRSVMLVISDFLFPKLEEAFAALRLFRQKHWEVVLLHLVHPHEERLPAGNAFRFQGLENEGRVLCSPAELREAYEARFARHGDVIRAMAMGCGCDYRRVSTATPYLRTLSTFLMDRNG